MKNTEIYNRTNIHTKNNTLSVRYRVALFHDPMFSRFIVILTYD